MNLLEERLGYVFMDKTLLEQACVHRSFCNENRNLGMDSNERLEFLGDSVLGLIVARLLYDQKPNLSEGDLSELRAQLVGFQACLYYSKVLELDVFVKMGKGEQANQGKGRERILADVFEALMGALYLDGGFDAVAEVFRSHFLDHVTKVLQAPERNWKASLQEYAQKHYQVNPEYVVLSESGPAHEKHFVIVVLIGEVERARGEGGSKKIAEQEAARRAWEALDE